MAQYFNLFMQAAFVENLALTFFLGMCTFLAVSKRIETAIGLGVAVVALAGVSVLSIVGRNRDAAFVAEALGFDQLEIGYFEFGDLHAGDPCSSRSRRGAPQICSTRPGRRHAPATPGRGT